jgi:mono/diheme cytochrome c family protein
MLTGAKRMSQSTSSKKENDVLAAFAGLVILMVILAILFLLTTPEVVGEVVAADEPQAVVEATLEVTEEAIVAVEPTAEVTVEPTVVVEATAEVTTESVTEADAASPPAHDPELVAHGAELFVTCAACHGPDGRGIVGLGKDLVAGEFATTATDEEIIAVITNGRPIWDAANTTMVDMPARGGNPTITDEEIHAIVAYIRSLQTNGATGTGATESSAVAVEATAEITVEPAVVVEATAEVTTESVAVGATAEVTAESVVVADAAAPTAHDPELVARGAELFVTCAACHGPDGRGIVGLGKDLVAGEFATTATDEEIIAVITNGRPIWDAANTTMVDMPARGGNPTITDEDIHAIVAYIRSLQTP